MIKRLLCVWLATVTGLMAYQAPYDLMFMPRGYGPERGHMEFGMAGVYNYREKNAVLNSSGFLNAALTDRFRYGISMDNDSRILHHVHATVYTSKIPDREEHNLALGFKNAAWELDDNLPPRHSVLSLFGVYSLSFNDRDFNFHIGGATDKHETSTFRMLFGADRQLDYGELLLEWDGADMNVGFKAPLIPNQLKYFVIYTPTGKKTEGKQTRIVRFGFTFMDNFLDGLSEYMTKPIPEYVDEDEDPEPDFFLDDDIFDDDWQPELVEEEAPAFVETPTVEDKPVLADAVDPLKSLPENDSLPKELGSKSITTAALSHMQKGLENYYAGNLFQAAREYHIVTSLMPNSSIAYMRLGSIYYQLRQDEKALEYWAKALELDPENEAIQAQLNKLEEEILDEPLL